jgi:hypothetical protein
MRSGGRYPLLQRVECPDRAHSRLTSEPRRRPHWRRSLVDIRQRIVTSSVPRSCCMPRRDCATTRSPNASIRRARLSASGASASSSREWPVWRNSPGRGGRVSFPPGIVVAVKALACELPSEVGLPLSRFSMSEVKREAIRRGLVASIGETTIWRWLSEDAIRPWTHRSWIFPRDPLFAHKAGRVLDLYEGVWQGRPLGRNDFVICADEKTSIQARRRRHRSAAPQPGRPMRVVRSLALRPGDSLTTPRVASSTGFSSFGFPPGCRPSYGAPGSCLGGSVSH